MYTFRITFKNEEGKKKSVKVEATGIVPAIEEGVKKFFSKNSLFGWNIVKAEEVYEKN